MAFGPARVFPGFCLDIKAGGFRERVCCPQKSVRGEVFGTGFGVVAGAQRFSRIGRGSLGFPRLLSVPQVGWRIFSPERGKAGDARPGDVAGPRSGTGTRLF